MKKNRLNQGNGFTLVELLVTITIGLLVIGSVVSVIVNSIRASNTRNAIHKARTQWGQITQFINTEIKESAFVSHGPTKICSASPSGTVLTLETPRPDGSGIDCIYYYTNSKDILRKGPDFTRSGQLNPKRLSDDLLARDARLVNVDIPEAPDNKEASYNLILQVRANGEVISYGDGDEQTCRARSSCQSYEAE